MIISVILVITCAGLVTGTEDLSGEYENLTLTEQNGEPDYQLIGDVSISMFGYLRVEEGVSVDFQEHVMEVNYADNVWINDPAHGGDPDSIVYFYDYGYIRFDGARNLLILNTQFGSENDPATSKVRLLGCRDFEVRDCIFHFSNDSCGSALEISNEGIGNDTEGLVQGCEVTSSGEGGFGIAVLHMGEDDQKLDITECRITTDHVGIFLRYLYGQAEEGREDQSPIQVYGNIISDASEELAAGIRFHSPILQRSVLVRNNRINNCSYGIDLWQATDEDCFPLIYNNAIFDICGVGIKCILQDNGNQPIDYARIRNNVIWEGEEEGNGIGIIVTRPANAEEPWPSMNDIDIANNVIGDLEWGIFLWLLDEPLVVDYNAFKGNTINIVYCASIDTRFAVDISEDAMGDSCIVHGVDGMYIKLADENPTPGYQDFHIKVDSIDSPDDLNMDLVDTGDHMNGTWMDPGWLNLRGGLQLQRVRISPPDMGIFGGPYSQGNIYLDLMARRDWIWVTDSDFRLAWAPFEYYSYNGPFLGVPWPGEGEVSHIEAGTVIDWGECVLDIVGSFQVDGGADTMQVFFVFDGGYLDFTDSTLVDSSYINHCTIIGADYGAYLSGVDACSGERLSFDHCTFDSCKTGIYANNSRVEITNTTITDCYGVSGGNATYLINCSSGKVIIDNCSITDNGYDGTWSSSAIYLSSSSPEIINCTIEDNTGCGIACVSSTPDLNTYGTGGEQPNSIHSNGGVTQSGSDGAEIYLKSSSYPDVNYNNIWDFDTGPIGYMIYKDPTTNSSSLNAKNNWWGATPADSFFYWGCGDAITYSPYSGTKISNIEDYETAMGYWDEGEFEQAARYFRLCINDTGAIGVNSVHYLTGCVGEMEGGNYVTLRRFFQETVDDHEDAEVARIAARFATHCLTELGEYDAAMDEYDEVRLNADCLHDSIMAVIDYLAVEELAEGGDRLNSLGEDIPSQIDRLMSMLNEREETQAGTPALLESFMITEAYPNPFNSSTKITYNLSESGPVRLTIHDLQGRATALLAEGHQTAGVHTVTWNPVDLPSGIYLCRMETGGQVATMKLAMVK